jgi:mono/diheme cytochrome c family protein
MKLLLSTLGMLMACTPAAIAASRSQRSHGATVFAESGCLHCHTIRNTGGSKGPNLSGVGRRLKESQIRTQILNGSKLMPPFKDDLQATELADLISYLRSCRDKEK